MSNPSAIRRGIYKSRLVRRAVRWMDAMAHPPVAIEITLDRMAGVRWNGQGRIEEFVVEPLPPGALVPSAIETNIADAEAAVEAAVSGKKLDPAVARRIQERAAKVRAEVFQKHGVLDIGVPAIREFRDR